MLSNWIKTCWTSKTRSPHTHQRLTIDLISAKSASLSSWNWSIIRLLLTQFRKCIALLTKQREFKPNRRNNSKNTQRTVNQSKEIYTN